MEDQSIDNQKPDWSIGELYQKAWELIKKHKILWVFGMAAGASASFNLRGLDSIDQNTLQQFINPNHPSEATPSGTISYVLGAATSQPFTQAISSIFSTIPWWVYGALILEFSFMIAFFSLISYIYKAWSEAALLHAVDDGLHNQHPTIESVSHKAFPAIKPLLWLTIVPILILTLASVAVFIVIGLAIAMGSTVIKLLGGLALVVAIGAFVYWLIFLLVSSIWASRIIVLKQVGGKEALKQGYKIAKKKFWSMILLGIVNGIMTLFVVGIPIAILIGLIVGGFLSSQISPSISVLLVVMGSLLGISFILGFTLLSGILTAFKAAVWSQAFKNIERKNYHE